MQQLHFNGFTLCTKGEPAPHDDEATDRQKGFMLRLIVKKVMVEGWPRREALLVLVALVFVCLSLLVWLITKGANSTVKEVKALTDVIVLKRSWIRQLSLAT
ncbi:hypothetical protein T4B_10682 [Trichinella pseudospiralis]|uniref:Uncharacterized protein n=2 Tax=Trichinella pseudospiralis TaxID=6337 RepID=A0A0V0Y3E4_TRIPS|nr:hypothetical protein T4E_692 [Trichinella pseudospiralis]KRY69686.1 hypothetical protein T4A_14351 [Trichinella pseudospiralis]KRY93208.1 hypothetical protein T4D_14208 [Trichinella pseudospiralis]KRZ29235.1 hypothetical protein T4B_10682 [Trichinella pseudospiralis]KRZ45278.1 hypothetical protein T4C_3384 [Trichinella pseudospiralis]